MKMTDLRLAAPLALIAAHCCVFAALAGEPAVQTAVPAPAESNVKVYSADGDSGSGPLPHQVAQATLDAWVRDLGSADYRARESAMRQLIAAGGESIDPILKASQTDDLEVAFRAVSILQALVDSSDDAIAERADAALTNLAAQKTTVVANLASDAIALYESTRQDRAIEKLRGLGAVMAINVDLAEPDNRALFELKINKDFKGAAADWELLKQMPDLTRLTIVNVPVDKAVLKIIGELKQLTMLNLYGTDLSAEDTQKLAALLPSVRIDRRNGALLGIGGAPGQTDCRVQLVQPGMPPRRRAFKLMMKSSASKDSRSTTSKNSRSWSPPKREATK